MTASTPSAHARVAPSSAERKSVRKSIQDTFEKGFTTSKDSVDIPHTMLDAIFDDLKQPNECISGAELRAVGFKLVDVLDENHDQQLSRAAPRRHPFERARAATPPRRPQARSSCRTCCATSTTATRTGACS